jgi:hypothetical protein
MSAEKAGWVPWRGELPGPVGAAFGRGRQAGRDWRGAFGRNQWIVRPDAQGAAACTLGAPPFARRMPVSAWRFEQPARTIRAVAFAGEPAAPWPPSGPGWFETAPPASEAGLVSGLLGALPVSHYSDQLTSSGLYRFFAFETGAGQKAIGSLRYWGSGASTLGDAAADLSTFDSQVAAADSALSAGQFGQAVSMYQAAGQLGATTIGPELDTQTGGASQPVTQQAWGINTQLATIPSDLSTAGQGDAQNAQGLVRQMRALYAQASSIAPTPAPSPAPAAPTTSAAAAGATMGAWLAAHGCTRAYVPAVHAFEVAYNASGLGPLISVDGQYGASCQAAYQLVLDATGGGQAPPNCFTGMPAPVPGVTPPKPTTTPTTTTTSTQAGMGAGGVVAIVAGAAAVVGVLAWAAATGNLSTFTKMPHH